MGDRDIVQDEVKPQRSLGKVISDQPRDHLSLRDQLARVELGYYGFEDFVHDGREDAFVVVLSEFSVDGWEGLNGGSGENSTADVDHL